MSFHGNSKDNTKLHHLYAIHDAETGDLFKYGISDKPVGEDGYSRRMREQVDYLNRAVGWFRYYAEVIQQNIPGRMNALQLESEYITTYREKHGSLPRGNFDPGY